MGWLKRKKGRKGEKTVVRTSISLPRLWFEELKMVKEKKGMSHSAAVEWCLTKAWKEFLETFGLDEKAARDEKERKGIKDFEEAHAAGQRAYAKLCQETSEDRYMRHLIFGRFGSPLGLFVEMVKEDPFTLWNRIRGVGSIRPDGWVDIGWQETGQ